MTNLHDSLEWNFVGSFSPFIRPAAIARINSILCHGNIFNFLRHLGHWITHGGLC